MVTYVYYTCVHKPRQLYRWYSKEFSRLGYKCYSLPFQPFGSPLNQIFLEDTAKGDALLSAKEKFLEFDILIFNVFNTVFIDIGNPELIQGFFTTDIQGQSPKLELFAAHIERAMGAGVVFSEGKVWKRKRKIITSVFNFEFLKSLTWKIANISDRSIEAIEEETREKKQREELEFNLLNLTVNMFSTVMIECFFGAKASGEKLDGKHVSVFVTDLVNDVSAQGQDFLYLLFGTKILDIGLKESFRDVNRRLRLFKQWASGVVAKRIQEAKEKLGEKKGSPEDLIEAFVMSGHFSSTSDDDGYNEDEIFEEFCTFFIAGTDTTSHFLLMMVYYIAMDPAVEAKLREEIREYVGGDFSYDNLKKLKYIDWIQKETTRMYGPVNGVFPRKAENDSFIKDLPVRKGTCLMIQPLGNHYSPKYFKDPKAFRPERWEAECDDLHPYVLVGFGGGARTCIGKHLALLESKIALVKIMKRYKRIVLPRTDFKMVQKFVYTPEDFETKFYPD